MTFSRYFSEHTHATFCLRQDQYLKDMKQRRKEKEAAFDAGLLAGEVTSPMGDFTTVTLSGPVDLFLNQEKDKADGPSLGQEIQQAEKQTGLISDNSFQHVRGACGFCNTGETN